MSQTTISECDINCVSEDTAPDSTVREEALDTRYSYIVQAPAGSGKTSILIQRVLALLAKVNEPEEILAITFTRKAAEEMRHRLITALREANDNPRPQKAYEQKTWDLARAVLERDKEKGWDLLKAKGRMRLKTIDSFCNYLVSRLPTKSHFGAPLDTEPDSYPLFVEAVRNLLEAIDTKPQESNERKAYACLLKRCNNNRDLLVTNLATSLKDRALWRDESRKWLSGLYSTNPSTQEEAKKELNRQLTKALRAYYNPILDKISESLNKVLSEQAKSFEDLVKFAADNLLYDEKHNHSQLANSLRECKDNYCISNLNGLNTISRYRLLCLLLLTQELKYRKTVQVSEGFPREQKDAKTAMVALLEELNDKTPDIPQHFNDVKDILFIDAKQRKKPNLSDDDGTDQAYTYSYSQFEFLKSSAYILELAMSFMRDVFRAHGVCDYTEIALNANEALGQDENVNDLQLQLDAQIKHILVDEYQDTSQSQLELLENLTSTWSAVHENPKQENEGRTIFMVGDPMQSIYRFRYADVGIFLRTRDSGLTKSGIMPKFLELRSNFRSNDKLISGYNYIFGGSSNNYGEWEAGGDGIFPATDSRNKSAISYALADTRTDKNSFQKDQNNVPGYALNSSDYPINTISTDPTNEDEVEAVIDLIRPWDNDKNPKKGTLAILVRTRKHAFDIIAQLRKEGIPYQAHDIEPLDSAEAVNDLIVLTRALLHLGDRIAWLSLLRSPLVGFNDNEITRLLEATVHQRNSNKDSNGAYESKEEYIKVEDITVWECLQNAFPEEKDKNTGFFALSIGNDGDIDIDSLRKRGNKVASCLRSAMKLRGKQPLSTWIKGTWLSLNGHLSISNYYDCGSIQAYFDLLQKMDGNVLPDVHEIQRQIKGSFAAPNAYSSDIVPVQILTMHGAKGLEYGTVILPFLERNADGSESGLLHCMRVADEKDDEAIFFAGKFTKSVSYDANNKSDDSDAHETPEEEEEGKGENKDDKTENDESDTDVDISDVQDSNVILYKELNKLRENNENKRILYVASTRAKEKLYYVFKNNEQISPKSLLKLLDKGGALSSNTTAHNAESTDEVCACTLDSKQKAIDIIRDAQKGKLTQKVKDQVKDLLNGIATNYPNLLNDLSNDTLSGLKDGLIPCIPPTMLQNLKAEKCDFLKSEKLKNMTPDQWCVLSPAQLQNIKTASLTSALKDQNTKGEIQQFPIEKMKCIPLKSVRSMLQSQESDGNQLTCLKNSKISALTPEIINDLMPDLLRKLEVGELTPELLGSITEATLSKMTPAQLKSIDEQLKCGDGRLNCVGDPANCVPINSLDELRNSHLLPLTRLTDAAFQSCSDKLTPRITLADRPIYTQDESTITGTAFHLIMQLIAEHNAEQTSGTLTPAVYGDDELEAKYGCFIDEAIADAKSSVSGKTVPVPADLRQRLLQGLKNILSSLNGCWSISYHPGSSCEQSVMFINDYGEAKEYRLDRIFTDEDGKFWIIDYKTYQGEPNAKQYQDKMQKYAQLMSESFGVSDIDMALVFVNTEKDRDVEIYHSHYDKASNTATTFTKK